MLPNGNDYDTEIHRLALVEVLRSLDAVRIPPQELQSADHRIGAGGFGDVLLYVWEPRIGGVRSGTDRLYVAVKWLKSQPHIFPRLALRFARELKVWSTFEHPNILPFWGFNIDLARTEAYFVSPYFPRGNMRARLEMDSAITVEQRKKWVSLYRQTRRPSLTISKVVDITKGMVYLHSLNPAVVHGDLKSLNILLDDADSALLCDFGLSSVIEETSTGLTTSGGFNASPRWCSPELLEGEMRTADSDMWAWALCVLEITTGRLPFYSIKNEVAVVTRLLERRYPSREEYPELPADNRIWETLEKCLQKDPTERPSIHDCLTKVTNVPPRTLSTIKTWALKDTRVWDISRSGRLLLSSYGNTEPGYSDVAIEDLTSGSIMYMMRRKTSYWEALPSKLYSFSGDEQGWALWDDREGRLYVYDIQAPHIRLMANIQVPQLSGSSSSQLYLMGERSNRQVLLFHCSTERPKDMIGLYSVLPDADSASITYRSVPEGDQLRKGSMSYNSRYFTLFKEGWEGQRETEIYATSPLLSLSAASFPEPISSFSWSDEDTGFWISDDAYAIIEDSTRKIRIMNVEDCTTRWIGALQTSFERCQWRNDSWLVYRPGQRMFHFFHVPTILTSSAAIDMNTSLKSPHFRLEVEDDEGFAVVQWACPDIVILCHGAFSPSCWTAHRILKPSPWW